MNKGGLRAKILRLFSLRPRGRHLLWIVAPTVLWYALRDVPLREIASVLGRLGFMQIMVLAAVNGLVVLALSGRWWAILRAQGYSINYLLLSAYRLAGFSVSYFTPGPQLGGEPLQIYLLQRRHGVPTTTAAASVVLDKTLELMSNFIVLSMGVLIIAWLRLLPAKVSVVLVVASLGMLAVPLVLFALLWTGRRPITWMLGRMPERVMLSPSFWRFKSAVAETEVRIRAFCRRGPLGLAGAAGFTLLSWSILLAEYWLALRFLDLPLSLFQTVAVITSARLAILLPFPGGLGVLEASQVLALRSLGYAAADGAGMGLVIRARDLLFGGVGLWLGLKMVRSLRQPEAKPKVARRPTAQG